MEGNRDCLGSKLKRSGTDDQNDDEYADDDNDAQRYRGGVLENRMPCNTPVVTEPFGRQTENRIINTESLSSQKPCFAAVQLISNGTMASNTNKQQELCLLLLRLVDNPEFSHFRPLGLLTLAGGHQELVAFPYAVFPVSVPRDTPINPPTLRGW